MWFDLVLLALVGVGIITGLWKGLAWQLAGIFSVVLGIILGSPLATMISGLFEEPGVFTRFLIFAISYALISLGCYLLALLWRGKMADFKLQRYDRHMGGFVGAVHGLVVWTVIGMFMVTLSEDARQAILTRPTGKALSFTLDGMHGVMPEGLHDVLHPFMHPEDEHQPHPAPGDDADHRRGDEGSGRDPPED